MLPIPQNYFLDNLGFRILVASCVKKLKSLFSFWVQIPEVEESFSDWDMGVCLKRNDIVNLT